MYPANHVVVLVVFPLAVRKFLHHELGGGDERGAPGVVLRNVPGLVLTAPADDRGRALQVRALAPQPAQRLQLAVLRGGGAGARVPLAADFTRVAQRIKRSHSRQPPREFAALTRLPQPQAVGSMALLHTNGEFVNAVMQINKGIAALAAVCPDPGKAI